MDGDDLMCFFDCYFIFFNLKGGNWFSVWAVTRQFMGGVDEFERVFMMIFSIIKEFYLDFKSMWVSLLLDWRGCWEFWIGKDL